MKLLITDPIDWELDANHNLIVPIRRTTGLKAVAQRIRIKIRTFQEECFWNLDAGVPWLPSADPNGRVKERAAILGQAFDAVKFRSAIRKQIISTPGVISVPMAVVSFNESTRKLSSTWRAKTQFGDTPTDTISVQG